jgi:hypothetical protein
LHVIVRLALRLQQRHGVCTHPLHVLEVHGMTTRKIVLLSTG